MLMAVHGALNAFPYLEIRVLLLGPFTSFTMSLCLTSIVWVCFVVLIDITESWPVVIERMGARTLGGESAESVWWEMGEEGALGLSGHGEVMG